MNGAQIRDLSTEAIQAKLNDAKEELMKLRFRKATGELTDTSRIPAVRREVARLSTILTERKRTEEEGK